MRAFQNLRRINYNLIQKNVLLKSIGGLPIFKSNDTFTLERRIPFLFNYVSCRNFCRNSSVKETFSFEKFENTMKIYYKKYLAK